MQDIWVVANVYDATALQAAGVLYSFTTTHIITDTVMIIAHQVPFQSFQQVYYFTVFWKSHSVLKK